MKYMYNIKIKIRSMQKVQVCVKLSILIFSQSINLRKYDDNYFKKFSDRNKNNKPPYWSIYQYIALTFDPDFRGFSSASGSSIEIFLAFSTNLARCSINFLSISSLIFCFSICSKKS